MIPAMPAGTDTAHPLDARHAEFIQGPVSVIVASRNAELVADVVRGCGCRVSRDRRLVTVLVEPGRASTLLDDVAANGMIAVVFSQPSTHETIQLKGTDARVVRVTAADRAAARQHLRVWSADLGSIGFGVEFAAALHGGTGELAAIRFTPAAAFQQTPGPAAGQPLKA
jgi:hypothetical protein